MPGLGRVFGWTVPLLIFTGPAISDPAVNPTPPVPAEKEKQVAKEEHLSERLCVDMNGKSFGWSWANVPFASVCSFSEPPRVPHK
jgi:hypothetical protein